MDTFSPPLSILFIWHPSDNATVKPMFDHCFSLLSRDISKPFSRSMNLPLFYCTSLKGCALTKIKKFSARTIIFIFISTEMVADDQWVQSFGDITESENVAIIPIAMDQTAFNFSDKFAHKNFIRVYDFNQLFIKDYVFISVAHEIYRCGLNESFEEMTLGSNNALKLFLSHTKDGSTGIGIATALKQFIDGTSMRNFFDATDIAPGYQFDDEIVGHIKESTLIAIHTDHYSSRYWCQMEILKAKENDRPIIAVDSLEEFEDRRFPFASNIPAVRIDLNGNLSEGASLRILSIALLETIRFFYSKLLLNEYKLAGWVNSSAEILSRPPEVSDIQKVLSSNGRGINIRNSMLVYPEPPLYSEELNLLSSLGISVNTPLTLSLCSLDGKNIGISVSEPSSPELTEIGQTPAHLLQLSQDLARHLLSRGAVLNYGGDLRKGGFSEFIFNEALALRSRTQSREIHLNNYIAWPLYHNDTMEVKAWRAKYRSVVQMIPTELPEDVLHLVQNKEEFLPPSSPQNLYVWSRSLTEMRRRMTAACDVRICAGGRHVGYKGRMPGVLEEIIMSLTMQRPIFLLGGFGGVTASVCKVVQQHTVPPELTEDWQINNNPGYSDVLHYCAKTGCEPYVDYDQVIELLETADLNNGLSPEENAKLFQTPFVEEALHLVFKGLKRILT